MEPYKEILAKVLISEEIRTSLSDLNPSASEMNLPCYQALQEIKALFANGNLPDAECADRVMHALTKIGKSNTSSTNTLL